MRLLKYREDGEIVVTSDEVDEHKLPPYAILSHTWGEDNEEVTFEDLQNNTGKDKPGHKKIQFCGEQAERDGLQYFWVDTCCIDKENKAEHSLAIRSMFQWYQNAKKCYVYLSDVSTKKREIRGMDTETTWEPAFRESRWFTRGWTLQELLAPSSVEFFSQEWDRLGDRDVLKFLIHRITSIPLEALVGARLSLFSIGERLQWSQGRETKCEEDAAYCLSGIFDVNMAPIYGEGIEQALRRLHDKMQSQEQILRDLLLTDPRNDKKRIEDTKGGLLKDSYQWVLNNTTFQQWQQDTHSRLLWVKGDPGKGKTMLLCGIINHLSRSLPKSTLLAYFFCQATDSRINSATAVLRGLLYMLLSQQPALLVHVSKKYDLAGRAIFEDAMAWVALTEIFLDVLHDSGLSTTYLIIDGLDECTTDLPDLLDFIAKQSSAASRVKWLVSSRNWPSIEEQLIRADHTVRLSLELNASSVATAVEAFIQRNVDRLAQMHQYKAELRSDVHRHLMSNANGTFLWVALICQDLADTPKRNVLKKLSLFPPGLDSLYKQMIHQIGRSEDAEICKHVLAVVAVLFRPVTITELTALVEPLDFSDDLESLREIIGLCGSFLTLREDTVYFVHPSAQQFLLSNAVDQVFPHGTETVRQAVYSRLSTTLPTMLHRDMNEKGEIYDTHTSTLASTFNLSANTGLTIPESCIDGQESNFQKFENHTQDGNRSPAQSLVTIPEHRESKSHLAHLLAIDEDLRPLYVSAMLKTGKSGIVNTLSDLLGDLYVGLLSEMKTERELTVVSLLKSQRGRLRMGEKIANIVRPTSLESTSATVSSTESDISEDREELESVDRTEFTETWIALEPLLDQDPGASISSQPEIDENIANLSGAHEEKVPSIPDTWDDVAKPFRSSVAFKRLKTALKALSLPQELQKLVESVPKSMIYISDQQDDSYANRFKAIVEDRTQMSWDWWPLEPRMRDLQNNEKRVIWNCACGTRLWKEITGEDAELLATVLSELGDQPPKLYECKARIDLTASCKRLAAKIMSTFSSSSAQQRYTPSAVRTIVPSSMYSHPAGKTQRNISSQLQPQPGPTNSAQSPLNDSTTSLSRDFRWILFGVRGRRTCLEIHHFEVEDSTNDQDLYQFLRSNHDTTRGLLKLWFSPWRFQYCEVVRFKRAAPRWVFGEEKEMPPVEFQSDYEFTPQPPAETANPPVTSHEFTAQINACIDPCRSWLPYHDCFQPYNNYGTLKKIPKKRTKFDTSSSNSTDSIAWGLEARYKIMAAYVLTYYILIVVLSFTFWIWWLGMHSEDLQNAAVPTTIVVGLVPSLWLMYIGVK